MQNRIHFALLVLMLLPVSVTVQSAPAVPFETDQFIDSIGVNIQLGGSSPGYANHARIKANLQALGIRHVRNPLWGNPPPYASFNDLSSAGIQLIVPTGYNHDGQGVNSLLAQLRNISGAVEGVEGINEPDIFSKQVTPQQIVAYQQEVYSKIKADAQLQHIPILAPSLSNPYSNNLGQQLTDLGIGNYADQANSHAYPSSWMPENHSWVTNMVNWANTITPGKPQIMTETGYGYGQPDSAAGIYTPRLLLDLICAKGLKRIYIYQLVDIGDGFGGLYKSDANTMNAQGRSIKNLIGLFRDDSTGTPAEIAPLNFTLSGDTSSLISQLFQQGNGDYFLVLWRAYEASNTNPSNVVVTLNDGYRLSNAQKFDNLDSPSFDASGVPLPFTDRDETVPVGGRVVIIKFVGRHTPPSATNLDINIYE